ncbi:hypothetical protein CMI47_22455 [Candidatus Pacearchaeota archaeon]|nr:hypothetical protein [Candidatus Pacearchaeota archaeon]
MANEHNTVTWTGHVLTASDGKDYNIVAGTTTDDIPSRMVDGTLYYIYWDQKTPHKYNTIIASGWSTKTPAGKHIISEVTGQSSTAHHGTVNANLEYKTDVPTATKVNITTVGNQDSITSATVSNMGSTATTGHRLKINTPGATAPADAGGSTDANRHWIRGFTAASQADNNGRWLDIDGYDKSISIYDGVLSDNLLTKMSASGFAAYDGSSNDYLTLLLGSGSGLTGGAGLRLFKGTATAASDATCIAHFHAGGARFYNSSGMSSSGVLTNVLMELQTNNIRFYNPNANVLMKVSATGLTFYDGTAADPGDGETIAELTSTALNFYHSSGKADANRVVSVRANSGSDNGLTLWGATSSPSATTATGIQFAESGVTPYSNMFLYKITDGISSGVHYYSTYLFANTSDITLHSNRYIVLKSALDKGVDIAGDETSSGLRFQQVNDTTNSRSYYCAFPISVMNGSDSTLGTREAAPWIQLGYYGTASSGYNHRPINAISSYFNYAGYSGTYTSPTFSWQEDTDTGMYRTGTNSIGFSAGDGLRTSIGTAGTYLYTVSVASAVEVNINGASGLLTKVSSSKRYKDNIEDLDINTEKVYDLRPVSFNWKSNGISDFGFIAEEVQDILPELVVYNEDNTPEAVKYKQLSILMLEELKKLREEVKDLKEKL